MISQFMLIIKKNNSHSPLKQIRKHESYIWLFYPLLDSTHVDSGEWIVCHPTNRSSGIRPFGDPAPTQYGI